MIYTGDKAPQKLAGEAKMLKEPIRVDPVSPEHNLDPLSRVNFTVTWTVEHNVKVKKVGTIDHVNRRLLKGYYDSEIKNDLRIQG